MSVFSPAKFEVPTGFDPEPLRTALQQEFGTRYQTKNSKAGFIPKGLLICYSPSKSVWVTVTHQVKKNQILCFVGPSTPYAVFGLAGVMIWSARYKRGIDEANLEIAKFLNGALPNASK